MFFDDWFAILRVLTIGTCTYAALILVLRLSGKRTLSKWNAFDFVVTVALGSIFATVIISKDVTLLEGVLALALLVGLQYLITWLGVRVAWVRDLIKAEPTMLLRDGEFLRDAMLRQRVSESEVLTAIRSSGTAAVEEIAAVVLETDGSLSVIKSSSHNLQTALRDVSGEK